MASERLTKSQHGILVGSARAGDLWARILLDHEDELAALKAGTESNNVVVRFATTVNIDLATTHLTAIDGVTPVAGDLCLCKDQTTSKDKGIYVVSGTGAWTRAKDSKGADILSPSMKVTVAEGGQADTVWMLTTNAPIVTGTTTPLTFAQVLGTGISAVNLASTDNAKGASLVGVEDSANKLTGTDVETCLAELALRKYNLGLTTNGNGASLIGIEDPKALITGINVETALQELATKQINIETTVSSAEAAAGKVLFAAAKVPSGMKVYVDSFSILVGGSTVWSGAFAELKLQDTGAAIDFAWILKAGLGSAGEVYPWTATNSVPKAGWHSGGTANAGLQIISNAAITEGSTLTVRVQIHLA